MVYTAFIARFMSKMGLIIKFLVGKNTEEKLVLHKSFIKILVIRRNFAAFNFIKKQFDAVQNAHNFFNPVEP